MKKYLEILHSSQSGQALLVVIVSLTVALAVVTSISVRNLSSTSRVSQTDTSYRVTAAAEGGAERFLRLNTTQLSNLAGSGGINSANCTNFASAGFDGVRTACTVNFDGSGTDNVDTIAYVRVTNHPVGSTSFEVKTKKDETYELNLTGYAQDRVTMCWRQNSGGVAPAVSVLGYTNPPTTATVKGVYCPNTGCSVFTSNNGTTTGNTSCTGYSNGYLITGLTGVTGLRVRPIGVDADFRFEGFNGATIPVQGFMIESIGELSGTANIASTKTVTVFKSYPFLPAPFDFGIYTSGSIVP